MINKTLFISCRSAKAESTQSSSYGRTFETDFTIEDLVLPLAEGYHRVIRYPLGALKFVIRTAADAYFPSTNKDVASPDIFFHNVLRTTAQASIPHRSPHPTITLACPRKTLVPHNGTLRCEEQQH